MVIKAGGGALAALTGLRRGAPALAQFPSPRAGPAAGALGSYGVVRMRTVKPDQDVQALVADGRSQFLPVVSAVPGYVLYLVLQNDQTRVHATFGVFADKAGADASTAKAKDFIRTHAKYFVDPTPQVVDGTVALFDEAAR